MKYRVRIRPRALKSLSRIPEPYSSRIQARIDDLADNPRPSDMKPIKTTDFQRIRVSDYRVVYLIRNEELVVLFVRLGHRKDIYQGL
jgi:mRNA interferase RelE/StbE